ncbi:LuxR C-terminal-related transcriptional regulator [Dasania sp. GY-MA-18]|uniref:LuxR C-terminal-related transcriptional regulator n=1 Tax=Dasania phycosphaerae TaxID=2950436 RepID=A0A9J6RHX8_9GAMM|nr:MULTISPECIES: LuxR C-terminal-related transcriptional regulator [Dasania]MCR8921616.1 LuxR C-terminal-related transcriptional regulator [Dasania sp. GY-MA-18]MCZ0864044.1 LuxR C-terminal-related transcriptional regulator [Dasania phycosphaerae]MCZ0867772.1 LuxR C-terminal-related transcriptional regulator [Dasania phycosphaerae]
MNFPDEFQKQCIELAQKLIGIKAARFLITDPHMHKKGFVGLNIKNEMEQKYYNKLEFIDPMHPSKFEHTDTSVISSNTVMPHNKWINSIFYQDFIKPYGYVHVADIFLRNHGKIIAILTLLRDESMAEFDSKDLETMRNIQPFLEYSLNSIYLPARISERDYIAENYGLTNRELDVLEYALSGADNKTIAKQLDISLPTVRTHLQHIYPKVDVHSTNELISKILRELNQQTH